MFADDGHTMTTHWDRSPDGATWEPLCDMKATRGLAGPVEQTSRSCHDFATLLSHRGRVFDATIGVVNPNPLRLVVRRAAAAALLACFVASGCADSTATTAPTVAALASVVLSSSSVAGRHAGHRRPDADRPSRQPAAPPSRWRAAATSVTVPATVTIPEGSNSLYFADHHDERRGDDDDYRDLCRREPDRDADHDGRDGAGAAELFLSTARLGARACRSRARSR